MSVIAIGRGVGSTIRLTTGLDPDEGINKRITGIRGRTRAEASAAGVAPMALLDLASGLLAGAADVDDELGVGPAVGGQDGGDGGDESLLVAVDVGGGVDGAKNAWLVRIQGMRRRRGGSYQVAMDQAL